MLKRNAWHLNLICVRAPPACLGSGPFVSVGFFIQGESKDVATGARLSLKKERADAGTGDLGVLTTHETSPWFHLVDAGPTRHG